MTKSFILLLLNFFVLAVVAILMGIEISIDEETALCRPVATVTDPSYEYHDFVVRIGNLSERLDILQKQINILEARESQPTEKEGI